MTTTSNDAALEIKGLCVNQNLPDGTAQAVLSGFDLRVPSGQVVGIHIEANAGHTLLQTLAGRVKPKKGMIRLNGLALDQQADSLLWMKGSAQPGDIGAQKVLLLIEDPSEDLCWLPDWVHQNQRIAMITSNDAATLLRYCDRVISIREDHISADVHQSEILNLEKGGVYTIMVSGRLDPARSSWFEGMEIIPCGSCTLLKGVLMDQAALFGVLNRIRDLGLDLTEVHLSKSGDLFQT
jgi:energy-coupling factor transporter ATP-binding protein EcfA2